MRPAGPRICLGQRLAELEGVFVLTQLMTSFSFRQVEPGAKVVYNLSPTMPMKQGLTVYATARA
jgi:cytochrome P450